MKIGAVVVLYNPENDVIDNILTYSKCCDELFVVDNSNDDNWDYIQKELILRNKSEKEIEHFCSYIPMYENTGIAKALNVGIQKAYEQKCDWVLTMDQDSSFTDNIIEIYRKYIKQHSTNDIAILCPRYSTDRNNVVSEMGNKELDMTMQSANLVNVAAYRKIGGFLEKLFIDVVDYEYCLRARKEGFKIIECSEAVLQHRPADTKTANILGYKLKYGCASPLRYYYQVRNLKYVGRKYHNIKLRLIVLMKIFKILLLFDDKKSYIKAVRTALYDYRHSIFGKKEMK